MGQRDRHRNRQSAMEQKPDIETGNQQWDKETDIEPDNQPWDKETDI